MSDRKISRTRFSRQLHVELYPYEIKAFVEYDWGQP